MEIFCIRAMLLPPPTPIALARNHKHLGDKPRPGCAAIVTGPT
jgi:hypothetical protein